MTGALSIVWVMALFGAPALALLVPRETLTPRRAWILVGCVSLTVAVWVSPVSLPGFVLDRVALGGAYSIMCVLAVGLMPTPFGRGAALACLLVAAFPASVAVMFSPPPAQSQSVSVVCGQVVRFESWGWVATGGTAAVLLWKPWWSPVEVQRACHQFDYSPYTNETSFSAEARGRCGVDVTYDGRRVWRAR